MLKNNLEDQGQEILRKKQYAQAELNRIVAELEKYAKYIPLVKRNKQLERELHETKISEQYYKDSCKKLGSEVSVPGKGGKAKGCQ